MRSMGCIVIIFLIIFAYISFKKDYLEGRGRGSSYILENYFDFGYIGVIIFRVSILGAVMASRLAYYWFGKKVLASTIILVSLTTFFLDSKSRSNRVAYVYYYSTILGMYRGACYLGAYICT